MHYTSYLSYLSRSALHRFLITQVGKADQAEEAEKYLLSSTRMKLL